MALVELLVASTIALMALGATMVTFSAVQRSFIASLYQVDSQSDQNRVLSYLRRDLRGASAVQLAAQGTQVTLTVPAPTKAPLNLNLGAALLSLLTPVQSAPATSTIRYYRQGTAVIREVNGVTTVLSASATQFQCSLQGAAVRIDASFLPRFTFGAKTAIGATTKASVSVHLLNTQS